MAAKRLLRPLQDPRLLPRFFCVRTCVKVSVKERWPKPGPFLVDHGAQSYEIH
jgi:hypothetical protein